MICTGFCALGIMIEMIIACPLISVFSLGAEGTVGVSVHRKATRPITCCDTMSLTYCTETHQLTTKFPD